MLKKSSSFPFGRTASQTNYRTLLTNKAWWGSSLDRCCRFAVAPELGKLSVFVGTSTGYDVTGLISRTAVRELHFGIFNHE